MQDKKILRKLAYQYFEIANSSRNMENIELHKAVNDLRQIRPVVLIDEIPWHEMNINNELTFAVLGSYLRSVEWFFRSNIYKNKYIPADMIVTPFVPVQKVMHSSGNGISIEEEILETDKENPIVSHKFNDVLATEEDSKQAAHACYHIR